MFIVDVSTQFPLFGLLLHKFFPVMLKNHFKCLCTGVRYYCLRRPTNHWKIAYQWELREGTITIGNHQFSIVQNCFRRVVLQSHYISLKSLPFNMS